MLLLRVVPHVCLLHLCTGASHSLRSGVASAGPSQTNLTQGLAATEQVVGAEETPSQQAKQETMVHDDSALESNSATNVAAHEHTQTATPAADHEQGATTAAPSAAEIQPAAEQPLGEEKPAADDPQETLMRQCTMQDMVEDSSNALPSLDDMLAQFLSHSEAVQGMIATGQLSPEQGLEMTSALRQNMQQLCKV